MTESITLQRAVLEKINFLEQFEPSKEQLTAHFRKKGLSAAEAAKEAAAYEHPESKPVEKAQLFCPGTLFSDAGYANAQLPDGSHWSHKEDLTDGEIKLLKDAGFIDVTQQFTEDFAGFFYPKQ